MTEKPDFKTVAGDAVRNTFEAIAFAEVLPVAEIENAEIARCLEKEAVWAQLPLGAPLGGEARLQLTRTHAEALVRTVAWGNQEEVPEERLLDAVAELLNTLAGNMLCLLLPQEESFTLGLPKTGIGSMPELHQPILTCLFRVDEQYISLVFSGVSFSSI